MNNALRATVSVFGALAGLAGIEHGVGEVLQGNVAPTGLVIVSWPESEAFRILGGEPAMTIVPNVRLTGIMAISVSVVFLAWATLFVQRKHSGLMLMLLSVVMLLVGGGFGPPILGIIVGLAATRMHAPLAWWRAHLSRSARRVLSALWPWAFGVSVLAWLLLMPGTLLLDMFVGVRNPNLVVPIITFSAFGLLLLTITTGFVRDVEQRTDEQLRPALKGI